MNESRATIENEALAGLYFVPVMQATGRGMQNSLWSSMIREPHFRGWEEGLEHCKNLDEVELRRIYTMEQDEQGPYAEEITTRKAVKSKLTGKVYYTPTNAYTPVQDKDIAEPCINAAKDLGLYIQGRVDGVGTGVSMSHILIMEKEFRIELGTGHNFKDMKDTGNIGLEWTNSYTGETSFWGRMFVLRDWCSNFLAMGTLLGEVRGRHIGDLSDIRERFASLITDCIEKVPQLQKAIKKAEDRPIIQVELEDLLWGLDMPKTAIDDIGGNPGGYTPEVKDLPYHPMNVWNAYNMVEAWVSYRNNSGKNLQATKSMSLKGLDLLTKDVDKIIRKGQETREAWVQEQKDKQAKKDEREATKRMEVIEAKARQERF